MFPADCNVQYHKDFISEEESRALMDWLYQNHDVSEPGFAVMADGSLYPMRPWKLMFVDPPLTDTDLFSLYHGPRVEWPPVLASIRDKVEAFMGMEFGVCVCLYYPDGQESISFHYDPPAFGPTAYLPSISLGAERTFQIRRQDDHSQEYSVTMEDGCMLVMGDGFQDRYEHGVPVDPDCHQPRINLTFRQFAWPEGMPNGRTL